MEGPSLLIAEENLQPFEKKIIRKVEGNTKVGKESILRLHAIINLCRAE